MERCESRLSRRQFVLRAGSAGLGLLAGCGRLPWHGQPAKLPRIGLLSPTTGGDVNDLAFRQGMAELGYTEDRSVVFEWRHAEGKIDRLPALAAELVRLDVDILVVQETPTSRAAKEATATIPIVMAFASDPVGAGLVASLARPGGNVTGLASILSVLVAKRLQLLKEALPAVSRVGVLWDPEIRDRTSEFAEVEAAGQALGLEVQSLEVRRPDDLGGVLAAATSGHADVLFTLDTAVLNIQRSQIVDLARAAQLPVVAARREFVDAGALMCYGANTAEMCRRSATYVDKILKGAKPGDLPVEQPMTFDFVVNMKTAQALGITFPNEILLQVTEVVQ